MYLTQNPVQICTGFFIFSLGYTHQLADNLYKCAIIRNHFVGLNMSLSAILILFYNK